MSKYLGKGKMIPGRVEEEILDSSWKIWSIGFDVHLRTVFVAVLVPDYKENKIQKFICKYETDYLSLQEMKKWLLGLKKKYGNREFVIESTSTYHRPIVHALDGEFDPIIINPAHAGNSKKKADIFDAALLAYHGLTGIWEKSFIPSDIQHDLTIVSRRFIKANQGMLTQLVGIFFSGLNRLNFVIYLNVKNITKKE